MATSFGGPGSASQYKLNTIFTSVGTSAVQIAPNNGNRYALIISYSGGTLQVAVSSANLALNKGELQGPIGPNWYSLTYRDYGPYVQSQLFGSLVSGAANVFVTEIVYSPSG